MTPIPRGNTRRTHHPLRRPRSTRRRTSRDHSQRLRNILNRFDAQMRLSLAWDHGREMARHASLSQQTGLKIFFAHSHSPWERGINENTNGLLRQYLPKGRDLSLFPQHQFDQIAFQLNARPRKIPRLESTRRTLPLEGTFDFDQYWNQPPTSNPVALGA